jgi:DNA-binding transcriptional LysR family regulator
MELRHLRYFVAVADELHVTRAASKLGIAQPALTQQIKALERELEVDLFARSGRGVVLSSAGQAFLPEAKAILAKVVGATRTARDAALGRHGRLSIGFTESASFHPLVTEAFRAFRTAYPQVELALQEGHSPALIDALGKGLLDFAFVRPPFPSDQDVRFDILAEEQMMAAVPMDHPLAARMRIALGDLARERFVLYPRTVRPGLSDSVLAACRQAGFEPLVVQETPQLSSTINLVAAGMGVSIVPETMRQVRHETVGYRAVEDLKLKAFLGLAARLENPSPIAANFRSVLERAGKEARRPGRGREQSILVAKNETDGKK